MRTILFNLLIHQLASFTGAEPDRRIGGPKLSLADIDLLNDIKTYLDQYYLEVVSLQQLTRTFYINSFKLKHGFKRLFSNSVMKYVNEHKMNHARTKLLQGWPDLTDLADELGVRALQQFQHRL